MASDLYRQNESGVLVPTHSYTPSEGPPGDCRLCGNLIDGVQDFITDSPNKAMVPEKFRRFPAHYVCWENVMILFLSGQYQYQEKFIRRGW